MRGGWGLVWLVPCALAGQRAAVPVYDATLLRCLAFRVQVRSTLTTQIGGRTRVETLGEDGLLRLRSEGIAAVGLPRVEAWWDSLVLWRSSPESRIDADTDGLLGGRYRGVLSPDGEWRPEAAPFLPPAVAEVSDLRTAMEDFFPRLPTVPLAPQGTTHPSVDRALTRLADSAGVWRYRWTLSRLGAADVARADTSQVKVDERTTEEGALTWSSGTGPVAWTRHVVIDADVPPSGLVRQRMQTRLEQRIVVKRYAPC